MQVQHKRKLWMAAICYHRWHAQLYLYLGPSLEMVDVPLFRDFSYDFRAGYIFKWEEKQESIPSKAPSSKDALL